MKHILVLYDGTPYTYKWVKVLFWARTELQKKGFWLSYLNIKSYLPIGTLARYQIDDFVKVVGEKKYDIVFVAYHFSISKIESTTGLDKIGFLKLLRESCEKVVWLDTADSTGNCQFEVMPYVDIYLKKQLLKDKTLYTKKLYGTKLYTDYYHRILKLDDDNINKNYTLLNLKDKDKLRPSWNIGLSDFWTKTRYCITRPTRISLPQPVAVEATRKLLLFFNGTMNYSPLNGYQRRRVIELMESDSRTNIPSPTAKMSHEEYVDNMKATKAAISPFGWGEICYRDFESFVYGATLLKPDMSCIETYPNFFIENETYVPIAWDFSDYNEIIEKIETREYLEIAKNGQERYLKYIMTSYGKEDFVNHVLKVIQ